ncbi:hypothetical protein ACW9HQ_44065, partial [Nocardia gipuzkoensis]
GGHQSMKVTVPAGSQGPKGPVGASGTINKAKDFDATNGPVHGSVFAYSPSGASFRAAAPPSGAGPWGWAASDFNPAQRAAVPQLIAGTFTVPALPYDWRPVVQGHISAYSVNNNRQYARPLVRLSHAQGPVVGGAVGVAGPENFYLAIFPSYQDEESTKTMSPSSVYARVPAGESAALVVTVERAGSGADAIGFDPTTASLVVYAQPL